MSSPLLNRVRVALMALRHARSLPSTTILCEDVLREVESALAADGWRDLPPVFQRGSGAEIGEEAR